MSSESHITQLCEKLSQQPNLPILIHQRLRKPPVLGCPTPLEVGEEQHIAVWRGREQEQYLAVFSTKKEQFFRLFKSSGMTSDQPYIIARGSWLFSSPKIKTLLLFVINPQSSSALQFTPDKLNPYNSGLAPISIEELLATAEKPEGTYEQLYNYDSYYLLYLRPWMARTTSPSPQIQKDENSCCVHLGGCSAGILSNRSVKLGTELIIDKKEGKILFEQAQRPSL